MQRTCLIAAHDPWFIQLLKMYAEECGFRVVQAFDGHEVLFKAQEENPAAIMLQLDLPGHLGIREVIKMLRKDAQSNLTPIFVYSWHETADEVVEGATVHLIEPVTYEAFVSALQSAGLIDGSAKGMALPGDPGVNRRTGQYFRRRIRK